MSLPAVFFDGLLKTLAGQLFSLRQNHAECIGEGFGVHISASAKQFFSIYVVEEDLPDDFATVGVLVDNRASEFNKTGYTFYIFIDSSKQYKDMTNDLKTIFKKAVLSHEICHFVFYYELFFQLGDNLTDIVYAKFQNIVSGKLENSIMKDKDDISQTVFDEHKYEEFLKNFWEYPNSHYDKKKLTKHDYSKSNATFLRYLTKK